MNQCCWFWTSVECNAYEMCQRIGSLYFAIQYLEWPSAVCQFYLRFALRLNVCLKLHFFNLENMDDAHSKPICTLHFRWLLMTISKPQQTFH